MHIQEMDGFSSRKLRGNLDLNRSKSIKWYTSTYFNQFWQSKWGFHSPLVDGCLAMREYAQTKAALQLGFSNSAPVGHEMTAASSATLR